MTLTAKRARTEAKKVANYLRRKHGATTVILFGSALRSEDFSPNRSDIDIYFEGCPSDRENEIAGETERNFLSLPLELKGSGHCRASFRAHVRRFGKPL
jgi:predicted nucleotidyltransferase